MNAYKGREMIAGRRLIKKLCIIVGGAFGVLYIMGLSKQYTASFTDMISIYAGSGLYNFNLYLETFDASNLAGGSVTFSSLNNVLNAVGLMGDNYIPLAWNDDFINIYTSSGLWYSSNVYSALKPYVQDFGYLGVVIFPLFLGVLYETIYIFAKRVNYNLIWIIYATISYPLVYFSILEQFFKRLHMGSIYELFWIIVVYLLIYKKWLSIDYSRYEKDKKIEAKAIH